MKVRTVLASLVCGALLAVGLTFAQTGSGEDTSKVRDELKLQEQKLLRQFREFEESLHKLKRRLSASRDPDDRAKAELLEKVIEKARDESIIIQFEQINAALKEQNFKNITEIKVLLEKTGKLSLDLQELLALMQADPSFDRARREKLELERILKMLETAIKEQRDVQLRTDLGKADSKELEAAQQKVRDLTAKIADAIDKHGKGGEGGEAKASKGDAKTGEAKGSGKSGESKDGGKEGKAGEAKGKEGKEGSGKEPGKEGKPGEAKGGEGKSGEKAGDKAGAKGGEGAEAKSGSKGSKGAEGAAGAKGGAGKEGKEGMGGEKKDPAGSAKDDGKESSKKDKENPGEAKGGKEGKEGKGGESKEGKGAESKGGESKGAKGSESKSGSKEGSKGAESKGDSKGGGESSGKGEPKPGADSPPSGGSKGGKGGDDKKKNEIGKKQVADAEGYQEAALDKIKKKDNPGASDEEGKAAKELEAAKKKLEELLRQIREEELERLLAALKARCEKMLAMQIRVRDETVDIAKTIDTHPDKMADRDDKFRAIKQSEEEKNIVVEATKALQMLEAEGSAVAFPEVFQQVREDMKIVQRRLELTDVGPVTQAIENDIIDTLREMVDALKKAQQEQKDKKDGKSGKPGDKGPPQDQKLLDQIAELKMIRSMQLRVNARTSTYARMYVDRDGEQARDVNIRRELRNLAERQERITEITGRIAKGDNK